jgi:hypothetical protein
VGCGLCPQQNNLRHLKKKCQGIFVFGTLIAALYSVFKCGLCPQAAKRKQKTIRMVLKF